MISRSLHWALTFGGGFTIGTVWVVAVVAAVMLMGGKETRTETEVLWLRETVASPTPIVIERIVYVHDEVVPTTVAPTPAPEPTEPPQEARETSITVQPNPTPPTVEATHVPALVVECEHRGKGIGHQYGICKERKR